jgi:hypothetical protein
MYSSKNMKTTAAALHTHWCRGFAEYLGSDFGDGLMTFADADFARDLLPAIQFLPTFNF